MGKTYIEYVKIHIEHKNIKLQAKEWAPKIYSPYGITCLWQYQNNALHEDDSTRVAQFKVEALYRDITRFAVRHNDLRSKLHEVQERHTERQEHIQTLQHNTTAGNVGRHSQNYISMKPRTESKRTRIFWSSTYKGA
jgi:hypothetical protein